MQALCFAANGRWQEEELGKERKHRWHPELAQEGKGVRSWRPGWRFGQAERERPRQLFRGVDTVGKGE